VAAGSVLDMTFEELFDVFDYPSIQAIEDLYAVR
jgi:hypothetical protein